MKEQRVYLDNILECIQRIEEYTQDGRSTFMQTPIIQDAVIRNFEVIGEATKQLSEELRIQYPNIPWRQMAGFRDVLIHDYMRLNLTFIWKTVEEDLPDIKPKIETILSDLDADAEE